MQYSVYGVRMDGTEKKLKTFDDEKEAKSVWSKLRNTSSQYRFNPTVKVEFCNYVVKEEETV